MTVWLSTDAFFPCRNTCRDFVAIPHNPLDLQNISDCSCSPDALDHALLHKVSQITLQRPSVYARAEHF